MTEENKLAYCTKCNEELTNKYCANCGNPREVKRIDGEYIVNEIGRVVNFDKGILYTIKELLIRPGKTIRTFILEDRNRLVKPIIFIIVSSLIYTVFRQILRFEDSYIYHDNSQPSAAMSIFEWIQNNYGYGNILMGIFIAFWIKLLFKKSGYNFYEILILICFVMGIGMLILAIFGLIEGLSGFKILDYASMVFIVYATWAIGQFFNKKKIMTYFKAFASYLLGMFTFTLLILLIGSLIDLIF